MNIGIVGLGVMGRSLALNFERNGYLVSGFDSNPNFDKSLFRDKNIKVCVSLNELVCTLDAPRCILIMVPAGEPVDQAIALLKPNLEKGDIIIDGGNSHFLDTDRRVKLLEEDGIRFIGMGISGGESGALWGPSLMPGGSESAWEDIQPVLESISAKASDGLPCVAWMGKGGAGHYIKMVHNGIEYGDMQLIAETYDLLHRGVGIPNSELAEIFVEWNKGDLRSYLIEITSIVLQRLDEETGGSLVDLIVDVSEQKGTGRWTSQNALDIGAAVPTIHTAVEMRQLSGLRAERLLANELYARTMCCFSGNKEQLIRSAEKALFLSKITSYAQGFVLLRAASQKFGFDFDCADIARIWRAGCIIRASLLEDIAAAFTCEPDLPNLLLSGLFRERVLQNQFAWRDVAKVAIDLGIPLMATAASLAYFDAYRSGRLPANLIQAQRDYFGAHSYQRVDKEGAFHTDWLQM